MKVKPDLSFWKLWNISFGFFGVQIAYALQSANISRNSAKRIYPFEIKIVRRITSFSGNELATVPIAVVCIALLVQVTLRMQRYKKYSG